MYKIILPRKDKEGNYYLSYSQISTWKRNKRDYIRRYFFNEKDDNSALKPYGDFGHKIGEALEHNNFDKFNDKEKELMTQLPRYDEFEREIKLIRKGYYIKGYIDTNTKPEKIKNHLFVRKIADYKTGEIYKRQEEYESSDYIQLELYSAALRQEFGVLPTDVKVVLIQRDGNAFKGEPLTLGDEFVVINREINDKIIDKVLNNVDNVAKEISEYYKIFLKLTGNEQD